MLSHWKTSSLWVRAENKVRRYALPTTKGESMLPEERARDWLVREDTVDHPGAYRLRLIASGTAEEIIASLERVLHELRSEAPTLDGLNAGSALCDWDIDRADAIDNACPAREDTVG